MARPRTAEEKYTDIIAAFPSPILRAYASCDRATILAAYSSLGSNVKFAEEAIEECIRASKDVPCFDAHLVWNYFNQARVARWNGNAKTAGEALEAALQEFKDNKCEIGKAHALKEMRRLKARRGTWEEFDKAHKDYDHALSELICSTPRAEALTGLRALVDGEWAWMWASADSREAARLANASLEYTDPIPKDRMGRLERMDGILKDPLGALRNHRDLGWAYGYQGKFEDADDQFRKGLKPFLSGGECIEQDALDAFGTFRVERQKALEKRKKTAESSLIVDLGDSKWIEVASVLGFRGFMLARGATSSKLGRISTRA